MDKKQNFGRIWDMIRFIKMWLLLRVLLFQEEHIMATSEESEKAYAAGAVLSAPEYEFVLDCTYRNLWYAFLPNWFRRSLQPQKLGESDIPPRKERIRKLDGLIKFAKKKGYIESSKMNEVDMIRISTDGEDFVTYLGGLNALLVSYWYAWTFIIVPIVLSPYTITFLKYILSKI